MECLTLTLLSGAVRRYTAQGAGGGGFVAVQWIRIRVDDDGLWIWMLGDDGRRRLFLYSGAWMAEVDPEMPWHVTAFHPDYHMHDRPRTGQHALARAYDIGREAGLQYVFVGNVLDADRESTYCPKCGEKLIQRHWYNVRELWRERGMCPQCNEVIAGEWG